MRWLSTSVLFLCAVALAGTTVGRQPGRLALPNKFKAEDYPNDAGDKVLLIWSASPGDNTKSDEVNEQYNNLLQKKLSEWRRQIADVVAKVPAINEVVEDIEFELLKRVADRAKVLLIERVNREPKVVYEIYYSEKPDGQKKLLRKIASNDSAYLHKSEPSVFGKHPKEPLAHFFKVDMVNAFCREEMNRVNGLKSLLASQLQIEDRTDKAEEDIDNTLKARLKDRATLLLLHAAKMGQRAEEYNVAYWIDALIREMKLIQRLGEKEKELLDLSPVDEERLKEAPVGERVVFYQRSLENAILASGSAYSSGEFGYYILTDIERKLAELEALVELEVEEAQKKVDGLQSNMEKAEKRFKTFAKLYEVVSNAGVSDELGYVVEKMFEEASGLYNVCREEMDRRADYEQELLRLNSRYNAFLSIKNKLFEHIQTAFSDLRKGRRKIEAMRAIKEGFKEVRSEFAKEFRNLVGAVLLYRYIADGNKFMEEGVINPVGEIERIKKSVHKVGSELAYIANAIERFDNILQPPVEEGISSVFLDVLKGWLTRRCRLISEQREALRTFAERLRSDGKSELAEKAVKLAEVVEERYDSLMKRWEKQLAETQEKLEKKKEAVYYFHLAMCVLGGNGEVVERRWYEGAVSVAAVSNWFNTNKINNLIMAVLLAVLVFYFINHARRNPKMFIRKISGLDAVDEAVGRATEMGKPVFYLTGLQPMSHLSTIASINILSRVSRKVAQHDARIRVPCCDPIVMSVAQEVYKEAATAVGRPDAYKEDDIFFVTRAQFAYAAAVDGMMVRERPGAIFLMGYFFAESLILAETGSTTGAIQIAGTDAYVQIPFFITTCDYTLIGEELYAASAYLSREPMLLGSLRGQDIGKAIFIIAIVVGTVFAIFGSDIIQLLFIEY